MKLNFKSASKLLSGSALIVMSTSVLAQEENYGVIKWMQNIEGAALYGIKFLMVMAFFVGIWFLYAGVMSFKANLEGDKQNNGVGKIMGNLLAAVVLMGGVGTIEAFTGTLFGATAVDSGAQKTAVQKTKGL